MNFQFSEIFSLFGGFLGIILSMVILFVMRGRITIKITSAAALVVSSLIVIIGSMLYSGKIVHFPFLLRIDSPIHYLLGPALYFYARSIIRTDFRFRPVHLIHLLPCVINLIEFVPYYFSPSADKLELYREYAGTGTVIMPLHYLLKTVSVSGYFIAQVVLLMKSRARLHEQRILYLWLILFIAGQFIMVTGLLTDHISGLTISLDPYRFAMNLVTLFLYSVAIMLLFFPRLLYGNLIGSQTKLKKYQGSGLGEPEKEVILKNWNDFLNGSEKPFLNPRLSQKEVCEILNIRPHQLSQVINEKAGLNFNEYVNRKRVEEAGRLLLSEEQKNLTIEAIAGKSGFNSKASFYTAFKKHTGMTPKQYIIQKREAIKG